MSCQSFSQYYYSYFLFGSAFGERSFWHYFGSTDLLIVKTCEFVALSESSLKLNCKENDSLDVSAWRKTTYFSKKSTLHILLDHGLTTDLNYFLFNDCVYFICLLLRSQLGLRGLELNSNRLLLLPCRRP